MIVKLNFWSILLSFAALQGFFLAFTILGNKKGYRPANQIIAVLVVLSSCLILQYVNTVSGLYQTYPHLIFAFSWVRWCVSPLMFLYTLVLLKQSQFRWMYLLHFVPALLMMLLILYPFYILPAAYKIQYMDKVISSNQISLPVFRQIPIYALNIQRLIYLYLILRLFTQYENHYKAQGSNTRLIQVQWLKNLFRWFAIYVAVAVIMVSFILNINRYVIQIDYIILVIFSFFIFYSSHTAIQQPERLFSLLPVVKKEKASSVELSTHKEAYLQRLLDTMQAQKPYCNNTLKMADLAALVDIKSHHLSQILNQDLNTNFYDFINKYRVEEVKKRLLDNDAKQFTLVAISEEAGFNSKSSFNRIFKHYTGLTPTQFIKAAKELQATG